MKKLICVFCVLAITFSLISFTGCGNNIPADSPYIGAWNAVRFDNPTGLDIPDTLYESMLENYPVFFLNKDGSVDIQSYGVQSDAQNKVRWSVTDNGVKVKGKGWEIELKSEGDTLIIDENCLPQVKPDHIVYPGGNTPVGINVYYEKR